jgi:hypothetical protein
MQQFLQKKWANGMCQPFLSLFNSGACIFGLQATAMPTVTATPILTLASRPSL